MNATLNGGVLASGIADNSQFCECEVTGNEIAPMSARAEPAASFPSPYAIDLSLGPAS
jgi:hypothetical protein